MQNRIIGYDLARALAVFGMVVVNFKIVMGAGDQGPYWLAGLVGLLEGRAAATFVVLAGVGLSLLSRKGRIDRDLNRLRQDRRTLLKRALFLFVVGALYTPIWPADILHFYGVYITVAAFLLATSGKRLGILAVGLVAGFVMLLLFFDYDKGWHWATLSYTGLWSPAGLIRHLLFNGFHPVVPWLAFMLLGMILGRQDMRDPDVRRRVLAWGLAAAFLAELASRILVHLFAAGAAAAEREAITAIFGTGPMPPMPLYMIAGAGTACAVIAVSVAVGLRYDRAGWLRPFVVTGQLALTMYVGHVVVGMGLLEAVGRLENQSLAFAVGTAFLFCTAGVVFAYLWRLKFKQGPLEALMRSVT